jgi:hypothetical protein
VDIYRARGQVQVIKKMLNLPTEILLLIFDHLAYEYEHDPEEALFPSLRVFDNTLPLLEVCRQWYDLFLPKIYQSLELHFERRQLYLLARSLLENPRLGASVRRLWVDCLTDWGGHRYYDDDDYDEEKEDGELVNDPRTKSFHDILEKAGPDRRRWQRDLLRNSGEAWMAICFFFLPNLQSFKIDYLEGPKPWMPLALSLIAGSNDAQPKKPTLRKLEEVIITGDRDHVSRPHSDFLPYFHLPSIRAFCGCEITEPSKGQRNTNQMLLSAPFKSSRITELALHHTYGAIGVSEYITACANLRVFLYEHTIIKSNENPTWSPSIIYNALTTQKHSLQVLYLGFWDGNPLSFPSMFMTKDLSACWLGSLKGFSQLREIALPLEIILDYRTDKEYPQLSLSKIMPSSVENLYLGAVAAIHYDLVAAALWAMLRCRKTRFPSLRGIEIWSQNMLLSRDMRLLWRSKGDEAFAKVKEMWLAEGVEFRYSVPSKSQIRRQSPLLSSFNSLKRNKYELIV